MNVAVLNCLFGLLFFFPFLTNSTTAFFLVAAVIKFFIGFSRIGLMSMGIGTTSIIYPKDIGSKIAILVWSLSLGIILGPILGQFFYQQFGYAVPFQLVAFLFLINMLLSLKFLPEFKTPARTEQTVSSCSIIYQNLATYSLLPITSDIPFA